MCKMLKSNQLLSSLSANRIFEMKETTALLLLAVTLCQGAITSQKECSIDSESTLISHENCGQYYECVHGVLIVRNCPASLYFNPDIQTCDYPTNVNCTNDGDNEDVDNPVINCSSGKVEGQFLVHKNCNQYFWCVHGNLLEYTCDHGLLFNHETLRCDWSHNVNCNDVTQSPDTEAPNVTETPDNTENPITETAKPDIETTPYIEDNNNHESDSEENSSEDTSSYESSNENKTDEDPSYEEASDENDIDEDSSSDDNSSENDNDEEDSSYNDDVKKICAVEDSDGVLIAHRDCRKFYKCSEGKPVLFFCPLDQLFNPETEQCDWPSNVDCIDDGKLYLKKKLEIIVDVTVRGKKYA